MPASRKARKGIGVFGSAEALAAVSAYGSQAKAAAALGIPRSTLHDALHGLRQRHTPQTHTRVRETSKSLPGAIVKQIIGTARFLHDRGNGLPQAMAQDMARLQQLPPEQRTAKVSEYFRRFRAARQKAIDEGRYKEPLRAGTFRQEFPA